MNRKRLIFTSIISILLVSILLFGSTYSLFTSEEVDEGLNVFQTGNLDIYYTVSDDNVVVQKNFPTSDEDVLNINPYRVTVTNQGNVSYRFDLILENTTAGEVINPSYIMTKVGRYEAVSLGKCSDSVIRSGIVIAPKESVDIDIRVWLASNIVNSEIGKSFYAKLKISGIAVVDDTSLDDYSMLISDKGLFSSYLKNLYEDGSEKREVNIGNGEETVFVSYNLNRNILLDHEGEYRYYGNVLSNYVWFNEELWRIVSVVGDRVRLVRAEAIGSYLFDDEGNSYSNSDLMRELNEGYYQGKSFECLKKNGLEKCDFSYNGLKEQARKMIGEETYYLGGMDVSSDVLSVYASERNADGSSWRGMVGLLQPSDYLFSSCHGVCEGKSWLYKGNVRMFTISSLGDGIVMIEGDEFVKQNSSVEEGEVFPVVSLKEGVLLLDGNGSMDRPYKIGI